MKLLFCIFKIKYFNSPQRMEDYKRVKFFVWKNEKWLLPLNRIIVAHTLAGGAYLLN
jgi:hypothetical protein